MQVPSRERLEGEPGRRPACLLGKPLPTAGHPPARPSPSGGPRPGTRSRRGGGRSAVRGDRVRHGETPRSRGTRSRMLTRLPEGIPGMCGPGPSGFPALAALLEDSSTRTRSVSRGWSPTEPGGQRSREGVLPAEVTGAAVCSRDAGSRSVKSLRGGKPVGGTGVTVMGESGRLCFTTPLNCVLGVSFLLLTRLWVAFLSRLFS